MDFVNKLSGQGKSQSQSTGSGSGSGSSGQDSSQKQGGGGMFSGISDKLNSAAGGGPESEKNEDYLDKGVDFVQEKFMGQGPQNNESAVEQAKDRQISDFVRGQYKNVTGSNFPGKDK